MAKIIKAADWEGDFLNIYEQIERKDLSPNAIEHKWIPHGVAKQGTSLNANFLNEIQKNSIYGILETNYKNTVEERWEIHGCNMAFWREDAIEVNGYNEDFKGWGPEDKEFVARLLNAGKEKRFLKLGGLVFHIHHPVNQKENLKNNVDIFEFTKRNKVKFCKNGIDQYL